MTVQNLLPRSPLKPVVRGRSDLAERLFSSGLPARVVLVVVVAVAVGMYTAPQAQDALITLGQSTEAAHWVGFGVSLGWLGANAWFWAHIAIMMRDTEPAVPLLQAWLPRLLALLLFLGVAGAMLHAAAEIPASSISGMGEGRGGAANLRLAAAAIAGLGFAMVAALSGFAPAVPGERALPRPAWLMLGFSGAIAVAGVIAFQTRPLEAAHLLQPAPTIFLAAAGLMCGGTLLAVLGHLWRAPLLFLVLLTAAALAILRDADFIPDNHDLRTVPGPLPQRALLATAFDRFIVASRAREPEAKTLPVVLVATGGGGIAAAAWTATILGDLADTSPAFADHLFAISGVSGGSLGAVEYVASLYGGCEASSARFCLQQALGDDFLSPALGALLYPDLMQRFVPAPILTDRAATLEASWEARWRAVYHNDRMAGPFLGLWPADHPWPVLLLNATSADTGGRIVASNVRQSEGAKRVLSADEADLLTLENADLPASAAADASARFPYFGPLGVMRRHESGEAGPALGSVVDGGYFENFGASSLLDLLDVLDGLARQKDYPVRFVVLQIISDPDLALPVEPAATAPGRPMHWLPAGIAGPVRTLLLSRQARGLNVTEMLAQRVTALGGTYVPVRLGLSPTGESAPLGWSLSTVARQFIDAQWTAACRTRLLRMMELDAPRKPAAEAMAPDVFMPMLMDADCPPTRNGPR
jgi:hypothetical protein